MNDEANSKPRLTLFRAEPTAEKIVDLFKAITGREPTDKEIEELREQLAKRQRGA